MDRGTRSKKFREMGLSDRLEFVKLNAQLNDDEAESLKSLTSNDFENSNRMIENAIGFFKIPLGIATNFVINNKKYLIPMAIEEPSVIAAASYAAKLANNSGGFKAAMTKSVMRGQVQLTRVPNIKVAISSIENHRQNLIHIANSVSKKIAAFDIKTRIVNDKTHILRKKMIIIELFVDVKDAMGANSVNSMCERIAPEIERITNGTTILKILSNYCVERLATSEAIFFKDDLGGENIVERMLYAYALAYSDPYRAVTHNKGIMNGIDAVALATGQDFRAIESAAHAFACRSGIYRSLTTFSRSDAGDLKVKIELPLAVGTIGGIASVHPMAKLCLKILGANSAKELGMVIATVGLAQNLAAVRALSSEGIQKGHMKLHAKNLATSVGANEKDIDVIAKMMYDRNQVSMKNAEKILNDLRRNRKIH
jgi:hydroxymethylglutaryl-CoA reductase